MSQNKVYTAIGLMSGTSLDGVDAALIETDGEGLVRPLGFVTIPYTDDIRVPVKACFGKRDRTDPDVLKAKALLTDAHIVAVNCLLDETGRDATDIDLIGFHGQTIFHAPAEQLTIQIGEGARLARETGIDVIDDFRSADVLAGGEGAPLVPVYHRARALSSALELPTAILNIGGVANVTWIGTDVDEILAFDTGAGNALMDDWAFQRTGQPFDKDGALAAAGTSNRALLDRWLAHPYFKRQPPKSLDRNEWDIAALGALARSMGGISAADGAATLLAFTIEGIVRSMEFLPKMPKAWYLCGGGRHNKTLVKGLQARLGDVRLVDELGWDGDATEAECFAYLAVRSHLKLPFSLPTTTGVATPMSGGTIHKAFET